MTPQELQALGLNCNGHAGPHRLRLGDMIGNTGVTVADVARDALHHAFVGEEEDDGTVALARAVLDRAGDGDTDMTDEEAAALIAAVSSAREYMLDNGYHLDGETSVEDYRTAQLLTGGIWLDVCWAGRLPRR